MPVCPKCGTLVSSEDTFCSVCGGLLQPQRSMEAPSPQTTSPRSSTPTQPQWDPSNRPVRDMTRTLAILGFVSAILSLLVFPLIFGAAAIILGAYVRSRGKSDSRKLGTTVLILGIGFTILNLLLALLPT